ncbi:unnamed protein product, partial [Trichogramma brassicae]
HWTLCGVQCFILDTALLMHSPTIALHFAHFYKISAVLVLLRPSLQLRLRPGPGTVRRRHRRPLRTFRVDYKSEPRRPERVMAHLEAPASAQSHSRLPQINVPDFSGRREDWESFRDLFNALIHQSSHLSNVERLYYLKTLVRGDARSALDSLQLTGRQDCVRCGSEHYVGHCDAFAQHEFGRAKRTRPSSCNSVYASTLLATRSRSPRVSITFDVSDVWSDSITPCFTKDHASEPLRATSLGRLLRPAFDIPCDTRERCPRGAWHRRRAVRRAVLTNCAADRRTDDQRARRQAPTCPDAPGCLFRSYPNLRSTCRPTKGPPLKTIGRPSPPSGEASPAVLHESSMWSPVEAGRSSIRPTGPCRIAAWSWSDAAPHDEPGLQRRGSLVAQNTVVGWTIWGRSCGAGRPTGPNQCFATTADGSEPPGIDILAVLQQFGQVEDSSSHPPVLTRRRALAYDQAFSRGDKAEGSSSPLHPHHGIWQHGDHGPRLRGVFDASRPTSSGVSLNDVTHRGPKLQRDIWTILLRWRRPPCSILRTDMKMMYRQIWIDKRDLDWQRVVWSPSSSDPIQHFRLLTVTYGTSCAPLPGASHDRATVARTKVPNSPLPPVAILRDRYVDDVLSGAPDLEASTGSPRPTDPIDNKGGFRSASGSRTTLDCSRASTLQTACDPLGSVFPPRTRYASSGSPGTLKTIRWVSRCQMVSKPLKKNDSKREVLSALATIFDPCGWLAPTTLTVKLLIQDMWRARLGWDDELPELLAQRWRTICDGPPDSRVRRRQPASHGRVDLPPGGEDETGQVRLRILVAKTKLAPIRSVLVDPARTPRSTIPKAGATGCAHRRPALAYDGATSWPLTSTRAWPWSDSRIVLHWIDSIRRSANSVVDGYVHQIQELTPRSIWRYVPSDKNPADVASRGATCKTSYFHTMPGSRPRLDEGAPIYGCALKTLDQTALESEAHAQIHSQPMTAQELGEAFEACLVAVSYNIRGRSSRKLRHSRPVPRKSPLAALDPFLDTPTGTSGWWRQAASLRAAVSSQAPPIFRCAQAISQLSVIDWAHARSIHGGFKAIYVQVFQRAWAHQWKRRRIRHHVSQGVTCAEPRARTTSHIMAPLPASRVTAARPFEFERTGGRLRRSIFLVRQGRGQRNSDSKPGWPSPSSAWSPKPFNLELGWQFEDGQRCWAHSQDSSADDVDKGNVERQCDQLPTVRTSRYERHMKKQRADQVATAS